MSNELTEVVTDDLRTLLFWASIGMKLSTGGYKEGELPHVLESYAEAIGFEFSEPPRWGIERLPTFRDASQFVPVRHEGETR